MAKVTKYSKEAMRSQFDSNIAKNKGLFWDITVRNYVAVGIALALFLPFFTPDVLVIIVVLMLTLLFDRIRAFRLKERLFTTIIKKYDQEQKAFLEGQITNKTLYQVYEDVCDKETSKRLTTTVGGVCVNLLIIFFILMLLMMVFYAWSEELNSLDTIFVRLVVIALCYFPITFLSILIKDIFKDFLPF